MSGLCGWFGAKVPGTGECLARMAAALARFDGASIEHRSVAWGGLACASKRPAKEAAQSGERIAAVHGRPRFTETPLKAIAERDGPAAALLEAYARKGDALLAGVEGSFVLAVLDRRAGKAWLAIDRMGTQPLFYGAVEGALVFASSLDAIDAFPGASRTLDRQAVYDYVYFHMVPGPQTVYLERQRLLPGTVLSWENGRIATSRYWQMRFTENEKHPFAELKQELIGTLRKSVADAAEGGAGTFLSGGTDSSTVAGMLREVGGEAPRTFSIGFEADGFDEMSYARIAAHHFGTKHHEYYVTPQDVVAAIPRIAAIHDQPFGNASAVPAYYCAKLAKDNGVETLLGGDGGDELFGGNSRYATQYVYSLYADLPLGLRKGVIEPLAFALPPIGLVGKAQRYLRTASQPMPERYDNYNLLERLGPRNVFSPEFLDSVDATSPRARSAEVYAQANAQSLINRMLALDLRFTLADNDLPKVTRSCELAGVGVRFPLLDDGLVAFSARLAPGLKLRRTQLRYFFKEALHGFLPDEIIAKKKHGFGQPFGSWMRTHRPLEQLAMDSIAELTKRRLVRPDFIDDLAFSKVRQHPEYYGTMVWVLMMLEQWFRARRVAL